MSKQRFVVSLIISLLVLVLIGVSTWQPAPIARKSVNKTIRGSWEALALLPIPRTEVAAAASEGSISVVGGYTATGQTTGTVERYDPTTDVWKTLPDLPEPINHPAAVGWQGKLWVIGGSAANNQPSATIQIFDPTAAQ
jgi:N-acetylneuraminic acid mutarotase